MTSENLVKETAKAIAAIYGEPSRWANYQIDARAALAGDSLHNSTGEQDND